MIRSIYITGANGFIGQHLCSMLEKKFFVTKYKRNSPLKIQEDVVIHLAGLAHDTRNFSNHQDYYRVNTDFTKEVYEAYLTSPAKKFIFLSSVKAVADVIEGILTEDFFPNPQTPYGLSKLKAEQLIKGHPSNMQANKSFYILRPAMVYGKGNKGNLNVLYHFLKKGYPWPLGAFHNRRSYCAVENLLFVIEEILRIENFPQGTYNVCDDNSISTTELVSLISDALMRKPLIISFPKCLILFLAKIGDIFALPFTTEKLEKLTHSYIVSNDKIKSYLGKTLPYSTKVAMRKVYTS